MSPRKSFRLGYLRHGHGASWILVFHRGTILVDNWEIPRCEAASMCAEWADPEWDSLSYAKHTRQTKRKWDRSFARAEGTIINIEGDASRFVATAAWKRTAEDSEGDRFDWKMEIERPQSETRCIEGEFAFGKHKFYRINVSLQMVWPEPESGTMIVSCSIRRSGCRGEWLTQFYPIAITVTQVSSADSNGEQ